MQIAGSKTRSFNRLISIHAIRHDYEPNLSTQLFTGKFLYDPSQSYPIIFYCVPNGRLQKDSSPKFLADAMVRNIFPAHCSLLDVTNLTTTTTTTSTFSYSECTNPRLGIYFIPA